jgi:hypothetical protein
MPLAAPLVLWTQVASGDLGKVMLISNITTVLPTPVTSCHSRFAPTITRRLTLGMSTVKPIPGITTV